MAVSLLLKTDTGMKPDILQKSLLLLTGLLTGTMCALAQQPRPVYEIHRTEQPPVIDGKLDDACWKQVPALTHFTQVLPVEGAEPTERTEVRFTYTTDYLFIAVRCFDNEPNKIIVKQMQRDTSLRSDDMVMIAFDTFFRQRDGYFFAVNPAGAYTDGLIENFSRTSRLWDAVWQARACIDNQGWTAEIAIPFKSLSFDTKRDVWGCNIERVIRRKQEVVRWTAISAAKPVTSLADFGELRGLTGMKQGMGLEVRPFTSLKYEDDVLTEEKTWNLKPGTDVTYNITPSLKANATFNTDFAEAEVDERIVNLTRFPLFFPEKRDFFLQDSSLFNFGGLRRSPLAYYSRRIGLSAEGELVDIIAGGRLTGRIGNTSIALLDVQQDKIGDIQSKNLFVGRVSTKVFEESDMGLIATQGDPRSNGNNNLFGFDFNYLNSRLPNDKRLIGHIWIMHTSSDNLGGEGTAFGGNLDFPNEPLDMGVTFRQISEKFDPALGFVRRTGIRDYIGSFEYIWRPNTTLIRRISLKARPYLTTDIGNHIVAENHDLPTLTVTTPAGDRLAFEYTFYRDVLDESFEIHPGIVIPPGNYRYPRFKSFLRSSQARAVSIGGGYNTGEFYNGSRRDYKGWFNWRPNRYLSSSLSYELQKVQLHEGDFNVRIASATVNLAFTPDLSWNTLIQYDNVSSEVGLNSRIRWTYKPGCDLFLVANQGWDYDEWRFQDLKSEFTVKLVGRIRF